jgi:Fe2+ transport system protein FeoA
MTRLDDDTRSLLRSLGLTDASHVRVCKAGDPFIIQVRSTRIGLSSSVAGNIYVVLTSDASSDHGSDRTDR